MLPCRKDFEPVRHVRFGSLTDIVQRPRHVRFTPDSGHSSAQVGCPLADISARRVIPIVADTANLISDLISAIGSGL